VTEPELMHNALVVVDVEEDDFVKLRDPSEKVVSTKA
jgi:hypothetical protein